MNGLFPLVVVSSFDYISPLFQRSVLRIICEKAGKIAPSVSVHTQTHFSRCQCPPLLYSCERPLSLTSPSTIEKVENVSSSMPFQKIELPHKNIISPTTFISMMNSEYYQITKALGKNSQPFFKRTLHNYQIYDECQTWVKAIQTEPQPMWVLPSSVVAY